MITFLRQLCQHQLLVSVAFTETGSVHPVRVRSIYLICGVIFALSGWLSAVFLSDGLTSARLKASITGNAELQYYVDMITELRQMRQADQEQMRVIAQEMGVLQARLDRFDALGDKLKADGTLITEAADPSGKGGPEIDRSAPLPSITDVRKQLGLLTGQADFAEMALETQVAISIRRALGPVLDQTIPYLWPLVTAGHRLTSPFGWRIHPILRSRIWHAGMDMADKVGSPVTAAGDGVVTFAGWRFGYGNLVEIKHGQGFVTRYGHLYQTTAKAGQRVAAGELIALLGNTGRSTGPHLHFEVHKNGIPLNPYPFIRETRQEVIAAAQNGKGRELLSAWRSGRQAKR
jgi:murein DD-endopeptidase MepM/ murein hydrolase activator NlpD